MLATSWLLCYIYAMTVLDYTDYRQFLKDFIEEKKQENASFSFRFVAHRLGCNPGFFNRVIKGERNLTPEYLLKLHRVLKLKIKEKQYFDLLVGYNQAKKQLEREHYHDMLTAFKDSKIYKVSKNQYSLYEQWYNMAIRELLNIIPCYDLSEETVKRLNKYLTPQVKSADLQKSLRHLFDLGIIIKGPSGRLMLSEKIITTGTQIPTVIVQKYLQQFISLGSEALDRFLKEQRVVSSVTFSVSESGYEKIKARLEECRRDIMEIARRDTDALDRVYNMNMQLFPLSKPYRSA